MRSHTASENVGTCVCLTGIPPRCGLPSNVWHWGHKQCTSVKMQKPQMCWAPLWGILIATATGSIRIGQTYGSWPTYSLHAYSLPTHQLKTYPLPLPRPQQLIKQTDFVLQTNYSIGSSDKMRITDKRVNKSDKPNYPSWQGSLSLTLKADFTSGCVGIYLLFLLESILLQTRRSVTPCVQSNHTVHSLGQDSPSLSHSELLICSFYLCPFFWNTSTWGKPFLGFCTARSHVKPRLRGMIRAAGPASYLWGFLWGSALFLGPLPKHSHRLSPRRISLGKINPWLCFNLSLAISRSRGEKEQRELG